MDRWAELRAVGCVARQLPGALVRRGCATRLAVRADNERYPVILVHGYAGTDAVWSPLRSALAAAGFGYLVSLNYSSFTTDAADVGRELTRQAGLALGRTGATRVHLIGHSMGGLIVRRAVAETRLAEHTATAVTIASPHGGAPLARIAPGRCARIMHRSQPAPGSGRVVRSLAYYAEHDRLVPTASAQLADPSARNLLVPDCGHLTVCRDPRLIESVVGELLRSESEVAVAGSNLLHAQVAAAA